MERYRLGGLLKIVSGTHLKGSFWKRIFPVILFLSVFIFHIPGALVPSSQRLFNLDEWRVSQSAISLFAGQTPISLQWPAGPLYALLFCTYAADFSITHTHVFSDIVQLRFDKAITALSDYIAEFFFEPQRQLKLGRLLVVFFSSFAPLAIFWMLRKNFLAALFAACVYASMPLSVSYSYMLLPEAISVTCWSLSLLYLFGENSFLSRRNIVLGGAWLGVALATRLIYLPVIPVIVCMLFPVSPKLYREKLKEYLFNLTLFFGSLFLCFVFFVPFLWTAPLTLIKSYLGNIAVYLTYSRRDWFFLYDTIFEYPLGWVKAVFCVSGIVGSFFLLGRRRAMWLVIILFVFLAALIRIGSFEKRHTLPVLVLVSVYCGLGLQFVLRRTKTHLIKILSVVLMAVLVLCQIIVSTREVSKMTRNGSMGQALAWLCAHVSEGTSAAIPLEAKAHFFIPPSLASIDRSLTLLSNQETFKNRLAYVFKLTEKKFEVADWKDNPLVESVFSEDERQDIFTFKMMRWYLTHGKFSKKTYDLWWYRDIPNCPVFYAFTQQEIIAKFKEGIITFLVSRNEIPEFSSYRAFEAYDYQGRQYLIYQNLSRFSGGE